MGFGSYGREALRKWSSLRHWPGAEGSTPKQ
jgi:hypothetical protein